MKQKRVLITRKGGPEVLEVVEREVPEPGPGEARVKVLATGVAFADVMMRHGLYPGVPDFPFTPGYDLVGLYPSGFAELVSHLAVDPGGFLDPLQGGVVVSPTTVELAHVPEVAGFAPTVAELALYPERLEVRL